MELIIGGRNQGKTEYARNKFPDYKLYDITDLLSLEDNISDDSVILIGINEFVHTGIKANKTGQSLFDEIINISSKVANLVIITDEVGNGIVPVDAIEREYRDQMGRIQIKLAKEANKVSRVVCGIGMVIKG